jgi:hypothetical protein
MAVLTVSTRRDLARLDPARTPSATLTEAGRAGSFVWRAWDLTRWVRLDPDQAMYVPPARDPSGRSGSWVRQITDRRLNVQWGGAVADSTGYRGSMARRRHRTDNGPVIERMLALAGALELTCYIPAVADPDAFFSTRTTIFLPRKVDVEIDGKLVNGFPAEDNQNAMLFQPGNFHLAYVDPKVLPVAPCGSPDEGATRIVMRDPRDASGFRVGDQIGIVSRASGSMQEWPSWYYHHLATVTEISGGTVQFDRPMSFGSRPCSAYNVSNTPGRTINGRTRNLFYWTGRMFGKGHIESERHSLWSDSAMVDCDVGQGLTTHARRSVAYGNMCQGTRFGGFYAKCSQTFTELSQQSVNSVVEDFTAVYAPTLARTAEVLMEANIGGDHARGCVLRRGKLSARGAPPTKRPMIHIGLAQDCRVEDMELEFDTRATNAALIMIGSSQLPSKDFVYTNNVVSNVRAVGDNTGYFVMLHGNNQPLFTDNRITGVTVKAKLTGSNGYSANIINCPGSGNALRDIDFGGQGVLRIQNCSGRQIATNLRNMAKAPIPVPTGTITDPWRPHEVWGVYWGTNAIAPRRS